MDDPRGGAPKGRKKGRRPENALTVSFVRTVAKPGRYCDGNGLYLQVDPSGARRWVQRLRVHGRDRTLGLGGCALAPLAEARAKAFDNRRLARAGGDPWRAAARPPESPASPTRRKPCVRFTAPRGGARNTPRNGSRRSNATLSRAS